MFVDPGRTGGKKEQMTFLTEIQSGPQAAYNALCRMTRPVHILEQGGYDHPVIRRSAYSPLLKHRTRSLNLPKADQDFFDSLKTQGRIGEQGEFIRK